MKIQTKKQATAYLDNAIGDILSLQMTAEGRLFLETAEELDGLLNIGNALARDEHMEGMKMQDLRAAIRQADKLILILQ